MEGFDPVSVVTSGPGWDPVRADGSHSSFLDASRALAAFLVVIGHVRHLVLIDYPATKNPGALLKGAYFVTGLGHEAVVIFFVISGYLVGGVTLRRWLASGTDLRGYAIARFSRIYAVLVPALLVGWLVDWVGLHYFNGSALYTDSAQYHTVSLDFVIRNSLNARTLLGNLAMTQGFAVPTFGSNGPLWSLAYEWWYYVLFALAGVALLHRGPGRAMAMAGVVIAVIGLPSKLALWGFVWLLGLVAEQWRKQGGAWCPRPAWALLIFLLLLTASRLSHGADAAALRDALAIEFGRDLYVGCGFSMLLVSAARYGVRVPWPRLQSWAAEFSYTTYLFHFPALVCLSACAFDLAGVRFQVAPSPVALMQCILLVGLVYLYSWLASVAFERRTPALRAWLARRAPATARSVQVKRH